MSARGPHRFERGQANPNWKGGRTITEHGYVLIKVPPAHHMADVRCYAYEHRIIAERKLGRLIRAGEIIHHIDGDKTNNDSGNIEVMPSRAHHHAKHRKRRDLRLPGEPNTEVSCECGCGSHFSKYDDSGRPRRFVSGHNARGHRNGN